MSSLRAASLPKFVKGITTWFAPALSQPQRKALLRCLIDKVALHRVARAQTQVRIIWRGGETTTLLVPVPVKSLAALPRAAEMEQLICTLFAEGQRDAAIAARLTALGYRSPSSQTVLPNTVRCIRLKQRLFQKRSQSHPRHIAGFLTVPQIARALTVPSIGYTIISIEGPLPSPKIRPPGCTCFQ